MSPVADIAVSFLRLGATAFGGPAAHLAMMEEEFVRRREWLTHEEFVDMIGAAAIVPGPNSTEVAIHLGLQRAGVPGMIAAGVCFILPAALVVSALAWVYVNFGSLPNFQSALYGIKPVVIAVVAQAVVLLVGKVLDTWTKRIALVVSAVLAWFSISEVVILLASGLTLGAIRLHQTRDWRSAVPVIALLAGVALVASFPLIWEVSFAARQPDVTAIFLYFLKVGSVLYGSGYVLLSFLDRDLVVHWHWLTKGQLLDAVAIGQFTPGPVFTTATFIGYLLQGPVGAVAATVGIFLPSFLFVALAGRFLPKLRASAVSSGFLDGVNAAALALMSVVLVKLAGDAIRDLPSACIALLSLVALLRLKLNSAWLIAAGGLAGIALHSFLR